MPTDVPTPAGVPPGGPVQPVTQPVTPVQPVTPAQPTLPAAPPPSAPPVPRPAAPSRTPPAAPPRRAERARRRTKDRVAAITGIVIIAALCAVGLGLAFRSGAYAPTQWLPSLIGVAALAVVIGLSGPAVPADRNQKLLLALFGLQVLWTAASLLWAQSLANTWEEINRTLFYGVAIALVFAAVCWAGRIGLHILAALVAGAVGVVGLVIILRLGLNDDPSRYFASGRLQYPISYFNGLAALLMIGFWLALGMANGLGGERKRRDVLRWTQPVLLTLAVLFIEVALLPQSRGALWTFALTVPFFVILSTNRFRALVDLALVLLPVVLFWSKLNGTYAALHSKAPLVPALNTVFSVIGYSVLIVVAGWVVTWLIERGAGPLSRRARVLIGVTLIVLAVGGATAGLIYADVRTGGLDTYLSDRWSEVTSDQGTATATTSRFTAVGLNGRWAVWKVATKAFEENPVLGVGAQNFEIFYYQNRATTTEMRQPHSQPLQLLAELGLPGLILWVAFFVLALVRALALRFRAPTRMEQAVIAAIMTALISWFIHSSADWLWQVAATSFPAVLLLGGLVGARVTAVPATGGAVAATDSAAGATGSVAAPGSAGPLGAEAAPVTPRALRHPRRLRLTRPILAVLALAVIVSAALPYLCLRYCNLASGADLDTMTTRTRTALALDPTSVQPFAVRANSYKAAADQMPDGSLDRVERLKLAAAAWVDAIEREPSSWLCYYKAAEMFLAARDAALAAGASSTQELQQSARTYLEGARRLNPLSPQVTALEAML